MLDRLRAHRDSYLSRGRTGELLPADELTEEEAEVIRASFVSHLGDIEGREITVEQMRSAYGSALAEWGVMCPHPSMNEPVRGRYRACDLCGCPVLHRLP